MARGGFSAYSRDEINRYQREAAEDLGMYEDDGGCTFCGTPILYEQDYIKPAKCDGCYRDGEICEGCKGTGVYDFAVCPLCDGDGELPYENPSF